MLQMRRGGRRRGGPRGSRLAHGGRRQGGRPLAGDRREFCQCGDECRDRKGAGHAADVLGLLRRAKTVGDRSLPQGAFSESEEQWRAHLDGRREEDRGCRYSGRFANAPRDLPGKKAGEVALFTEADISDWMFMRNGKIVGGETIRPLLKSLPKADADALRARLETP